MALQVLMKIASKTDTH